MMTRGARLLMAVVPMVLATAACAGTGVATVDGARGGGATGGGAGSGATVAVRVERTGGFVPADLVLTRLPIVAIYADGQVIDEGPQIAIAPPPAWPNVQLRRIPVADVRRLVDRAVAAGIGTERDFGQPPIADATSTRFTIRTASGVTRAEIPALLESDGSGLTAHQQAARRAARSLYDALTDLPATLGAGAVGTSTTYLPAAVAAIAAPWTDTCSSPDTTALAGTEPGGLCADGLPRQAERSWPGPALPGEPLRADTELSCVTARGDAATKVTAAARQAVTTTAWRSGGKRWRVSLRPLLPDESGCADVRRAS
ncbi:conserved exported hypothetical protein [Frankia sp. AiPs1]